jgi:hypothetical protein
VQLDTISVELKQIINFYLLKYLLFRKRILFSTYRNPIIPQRIKEELKGAQKYFNHKKRCIFCDYIKLEIQSKDRLIKETEKYIVISPFAARFLIIL